MSVLRIHCCHVNHFLSSFLSSFSYIPFGWCFFFSSLVFEKELIFFCIQLCALCVFVSFFLILSAFKARENNYADEYQRAISRMSHKATEHIFNLYSSFWRRRKGIQFYASRFHGVFKMSFSRFRFLLFCTQISNACACCQFSDATTICSNLPIFRSVLCT